MRDFFKLNPKLRNEKGFSLIELSLVLIIIGLIIFGVIGSKVLIKKARLSSARMLTLNSPVTQIEGLVFWLEPTLDGAFKDSSGNILEWDSEIELWKNKTGYSGENISIARKDSDGSNGISNAPTAIEEGRNGLPILSFASGDCLETSYTFSDKFTFFIVSTKSEVGAYVIGSTGGSSSPGFLSYPGDTLPAFAFWDFGVRTTIKDNTNDSLHIAIVRREDGVEGDFFFDGEEVVSNLSTANFYETKIFNTIGGSQVGSCGYVGEIAEIIIYDELLTNEQIESISNYLMKKYKIK
jgi:prepilin-type N-terminal cleavage/methylation domain-containing protein